MGLILQPVKCFHQTTDFSEYQHKSVLSTQNYNLWKLWFNKGLKCLKALLKKLQDKELHFLRYLGPVKNSQELGSGYRTGVPISQQPWVTCGTPVQGRAHPATHKDQQQHSQHSNANTLASGLSTNSVTFFQFKRINQIFFEGLSWAILWSAEGDCLGFGWFCFPLNNILFSEKWELSGCSLLWAC